MHGNIEKIPLIDLSPFYSGDQNAKLKVAMQVNEACLRIGFFSVTGHRVPQGLIENLREVSHAFFEQPDKVKYAYAHSKPDTPRGFRGLAGEALGRTIKPNAPPDLKEFFHFGRETWPNDPYFKGREGKNYFIPNIWPSEPSSFRRVALDYYREMDRLVKDIVHIIALALGLPETWFDDKIDKHATAARLNYYPAQEHRPPAGQLRSGEHTDYGMLTILMGENEPGGLQVRTRSGHWIDVETRPDFFIINIADQLMRWTNDTWVSNLHRVANPGDRPQTNRGRLSIGYFFQPNYDAVIKCIPTCSGPKNPPKYEPLVAGKYRDLKYKQGNKV